MQPTDLCSDCQDAYDERAAILEYDGELSRDAAERLAFAELYRRYCGCRIKSQRGSFLVAGHQAGARRQAEPTGSDGK